MMSDSWRILYVEDNQELGRQVCEVLEEGNCGPVVVHLVTSFEDAKEDIESRRYDLLILDVFAGRPALDAERVGINLLEHLKQVRFTPTILYTALPVVAENLASPFVKVLRKEGNGFEPLLEIITEFLQSGLLALNRGLSNHIEKVQLEYMEQFVTAHWADFTGHSDKRALAYLLARRLAKSLASEHIHELAEILGEVPPQNDELPTAEDLVHPMQLYIIPPIGSDFLTGDIVKGDIKGRDGHWVVLTPSCDMVTGGNRVAKADYVHLAFCRSLSDFSEYNEWLAQPDNHKKRDPLVDLLRNNRRGGQRERYHYLPGVFNIPHMVVDFQQVDHVSHDELKAAMHPLASLDSPYAESLLGRYNRYCARFGTPDLDIDEVLKNLGKSLLNFPEQ